MPKKMVKKHSRFRMYIRNRELFFLIKKAFNQFEQRGIVNWSTNYMPKKILKLITLFDGHGHLIKVKIDMPKSYKKFRYKISLFGLKAYLLEKFNHQPSIDHIRYVKWFERTEKTKSIYELSGDEIGKNPSIAFVVFGQTKNKKDQETLQSIKSQNYKHVKIIRARKTSFPKLKRNLKSDYVIFIRSGDKLAKNALNIFVHEIIKSPKTELIYGDEDMIRAKGRRTKPFFKPTWSPDTLKSFNYIGNGSCISTHILTKSKVIGAINSQNIHNLYKHISPTAKVKHIPQILYHSRTGVQNPIPRGAINDSKEKVTIIIPFRDKVDLLKKCLKSILQKTDYTNYEILLVDNQSKNKSTLKYLQQIKQKPNIRVIKYNKPFNYSALNNYAMKKVNTELVLFLNNDTEVITPKWLDEMVYQISSKHVGAVGAKLLFKDDTVQHGGVIVGLGGAAGHAFQNKHKDDNGYFNLASIVRNTAAVTGACLLTRKSLFERLGGFDAKELGISLNDIDYCLRLIQNGKLIVYTPYAKLYHHESASRGSKLNKTIAEELHFRQIRERDNFIKKWPKYVENDPYYNPNLSRRVSLSYKIA